MRITGTSHLAAPPTEVWRALNDPAVLVRTLPGCRRLEALGDDAYAMTLAAGVGSVKGVYDGQVRLSDQQEPGSFRMHAHGAGAPGTVTADVLVTLDDTDDGGTALSYEADATVGGMVGGVGQRMLAGVSKKMAGEFFANVDALLAVGQRAGAGGPTDGEGATLDGSGGRPSEARPAGFGAPSSSGRSPDPAPAVLSTAASPPPARSTVASPGQVYTSATGEGDGDMFVRGVAVGAAAALAGAVVGAWITRRGWRLG